MNEVVDQANALVARREQCSSMRRVAGVTACHASEAYDYVHVTARPLHHDDDGAQLDVYAVFDERGTSHATRCEVVRRRADTPPHRDPAAEQLCRHTRLDLLLPTLLASFE